MKISNGLEIVTTPSADGKIYQETFSIENDIRRVLVKQVSDTKEQQFREALIKLGWTPPENEIWNDVKKYYIEDR